MMVADYHVYALAFRIIDLFIGLYATVKGYYKAETIIRRPVNPLIGHSVSFVISFWDIEINPVRKPCKE